MMTQNSTHLHNNRQTSLRNKSQVENTLPPRRKDIHTIQLDANQQVHENDEQIQKLKNQKNRR